VVGPAGAAGAGVAAAAPEHAASPNQDAAARPKDRRAGEVFRQRDDGSCSMQGNGHWSMQATLSRCGSRQVAESVGFEAPT